MAEEFGRHGISFVFVYTREAHPGGDYPCHASFEQKLSHARDMVARWSIKRPMLVDDLEGTVHRAYGTLPNMTYLLSAGGNILYRASWTDARTIRIALMHVLYERGVRRSGTRISPYYVEWMPRRANDRITFLEEVARDTGRRAVEEFIAAVAHTGGEAAARPLREWWVKRQSAQVETPAD